ncbi:MAG: sugar ABC transporter permease [Eubacteriales bacterium]
MVKSQRKIYSLYLVLPALILYLLYFIVPSGAGMLYAFTFWTARTMDTPVFNGIDNFIYIFTTPELVKGLWNTLYFAVSTVILKNVIGLGLGLLVNNNTFLGKYYARGVFFLPNFLNMVVIGVIFVAFLHPTGPLNLFLESVGLGFFAQDWLNDIKYAMSTIVAVEVWRTSGYHMVIYIAALKSISIEYYQAAQIDGASAIQRFKYITLPMISQGLTINIILAIISGLKVFDQVYVLTSGGPGNSTNVVLTFVGKMFGQGQWGEATAYNLVLTVMIFVLCLGVLLFIEKKGGSEE